MEESKKIDLMQKLQDEADHHASQGPNREEQPFVIMHPGTWDDLAKQMSPYDNSLASFVGQPWQGKKLMFREFQIFRSQDVEEGEFKFKLF